MPQDVAHLFLKFSTEKLSQLSARIEDCLGRLSEEQIWLRGSDSQNTAGNLVLHLCGNLRQWIGAGVAGMPDIRRRQEEFDARGGISAAELRGRLRTTVGETVAIIQGLPARRLQESITVQSYDVTLLEAVYHVVEHFSQHTGQIIFITKLVTGEELGYYLHLNKPNVRSPEVP